jgi:hypothetical protein
MVAGKKAAHTKKWRRAQRLAHATGKSAKTFTKYFLRKHGYRATSFDSRRGYEGKGIVDLVAVKRDTKDPDLLMIVLFQVKGGRARVTPDEITRLRRAARRLKIRWNVAEKPQKAVKFRKTLS